KSREFAQWQTYLLVNSKGEGAKAPSVVRLLYMRTILEVSNAGIQKTRVGGADELSRKCNGRTIERGSSTYRMKGIGITVRDNGKRNRVFVHLERLVATYSVSGVREPEDVGEGDRHRQEFWRP
ncbi:putative nicotinate phosphoribosyltransferase, partial [Trichinella spiralis]|uniref:putative nicotinate phosphoribosyltransferase n=1 Tax=Trichinella spiralis TaxID=6334 RepID=UPI0001EFEF66